MSNNNKNSGRILAKNESALVNNPRSLNKLDHQQTNIEALVKNGETKIFLNNIAKSIMEDLKEFCNQSVEIFNTINTDFAQECHSFFKNSCKHND